MNDFRNTTQEITDNAGKLRGMMNSETDKEKIEITARISKSALDLAGIYKKIVNVSDITTGTLKLNYSRVNVLGFFNDLAENSSLIADKKQIKLLSSHDNILPVENYMDVNKIWIAISRIIENAVKFSETEKSVEFFLKYSDNSLKFLIRDYGIGMNEEQISGIFKFNTGDDEENKQGVSLPIVKKIVDAHNGDILVESKFGGGTTFTVSIPLLEDI
jgi:two-component system sensor histidine kinase SenX3